MWTDTPEGRAFVTEVSRTVIAQTAPEEEDLFDELAAGYYAHPAPPDRSARRRDDPLGFGAAEVIVAATPAVIAMANVVVSQVLSQVLKLMESESGELVKKRIKSLFALADKPDKPDKLAHQAKDAPTLSKDELEEVLKLARKVAIDYGMEPPQARHMAEALVGALALA